MPTYLEQVLEGDLTTWDPGFALQSSINWARGLASEIHSEHGPTPPDQATSLRKHFATIKPAPPPQDLGPILLPLYHSLSFAMTLATATRIGMTKPWTFPSNVITWYYATYGAFRSMLAAAGSPAPYQHGPTARVLQDSGFATKLPHPFNMAATRKKNEEFGKQLPSHPAATDANLTKGFDGTRAMTQGFLLQYLGGTAQYHVDDVKQKLLEKELKKMGKKNFQSAEARKLRDDRIRKTIGFLDCAYRYRGKMNYRDPTLFAYGAQHPWIRPSYVEDLRDAAQFSALTALAYVERRHGQPVSQEIVQDATKYLRSQAELTTNELFFTAFA